MKSNHYKYLFNIDFVSDHNIEWCACILPINHGEKALRRGWLPKNVSTTTVFFPFFFRFFSFVSLCSSICVWQPGNVPCSSEILWISWLKLNCGYFSTQQENAENALANTVVDTFHILAVDLFAKPKFSSQCEQKNVLYMYNVWTTTTLCNDWRRAHACYTLPKMQWYARNAVNSSTEAANYYHAAWKSIRAIISFCCSLGLWLRLACMSRRLGHGKSTNIRLRANEWKRENDNRRADAMRTTVATTK